MSSVVNGDPDDSCILRYEVHLAGDTFTIYEDRGAPQDHRFIGYFNGDRSVTASRPEMAARALSQKHIIHSAEGQVIDMVSWTANRRRASAA